MVDLRDQGEAFALEPVHHPHLPQRPLAVEGPGEDLTHDLLELAIRSGGWQAHVPHVVVQVEAIVVDPDRVSLEGREGEPTPVAGEEVKARLDVLPQAIAVEASVLPAQGLALEDRHGRDVHRSGSRLEVKERRVLCGQPEVRSTLHRFRPPRTRPLGGRGRVLWPASLWEQGRGSL